MSHSPGGGVPGRPCQPYNAQQWHQYHRCVEFGIQYPPDPDQVYASIQLLKKDGDYALNNNNFAEALPLYSRALRGFELLPKVSHIADEHHKLLCNRSLVFLKTRQFKEAERDAIEAIASCPTFTKSYWIASQAVSGGYNDVQRTLPYLVDGLTMATRGEGNSHDIVTFLTEICILVPRAPATDAMEKLLTDQLVIPYGDGVSEIWNKVIQNLASQNNWQSLAMLLTGYNEGVSCALEDQDTSTWNWSSVNVGSLLSFLSDDAFIKWGKGLAVKLIEFGSDVEEIGKKFDCLSLHHVVRLSLRLGSINLLRCILEKYRHTPDKINSVDGDGSTALHIVVRSGIEIIDNKLRVLDLLLEYKCNVAQMDRFNKKPIDYTDQNDSLYHKLQTASKSVDELRQYLDALKSLGNIALKAGKHSEALCKYDKALAISKLSDQLYKEAAVLYSSRAKVFFTLQNYTDALANALAAVSCDSSYYKGHWWKARTLFTTGSTFDAFRAFMDGYIQSEVSGEVKFNFLIEAVTQLTHVTNEHFMTCYNQLRFLDRDIWPSVLSKLSRNVEWKIMAYLILGPNLDGQRMGRKVDRTSIATLCTGVAGPCHTVEVQTNTIFQYLRNSDCDSKLDGPWLDAVLFAVYIHGNEETLKCLAVDDTDCPLHAAVRFAFLTGRESLVEELASLGKEFPEQMAVNPIGDSVFHFITNFRPCPETEILITVMNLLLKQGISVNVKDARGKLPIDYLDKNYPRSVFDMFFTPSTSHSVDDINRFTEVGNVWLVNGAVADAVYMYSQAIDIFRSCEAKTVNNGTIYVFCYSRVGHDDNPDVDQLPDAMPRGTFNPVPLSDDQPSIVTFDLETTDLIRGGVIPHITQIAATNLQTGDKLNLYVQPGCPISAEAQRVTGITTNGTSMAVNGKEVESADIKTGLQKLCSWLQKFKDVCLVAHNGLRFDFPVVITALVKNNLKEQFMQCVTAFCDSMALFRKVFPNQCLKQESLVKSVLGVPYDAHNAMADVESLGRLIQHTLPQVKSITEFTFSPEAVHNNILYNKQKSLNIRSLDMLMAKGVFKRPTADNIAGSGLHVCAELTEHEIAVLFGNRAKAYLKLHQYQEALDDAMQSVTFDSKWYKAHVWVGKAMRGLQRMEEAKTAFINAYCNTNTNVEDEVKVNILVELASVCSEMPKSVWNVSRMIEDLPNDEGHLWARACYELASNNYWNKAAVAYYQFSYSVSKIQELTWTLKPFSDLKVLKEHGWGVDMLHYFLECGCNRKTISLEDGDTYLHAVVRISLVVGNLSLLQYLLHQYCRQGDTDQHNLDIHSNSILHAATKENCVDKKNRHDAIVLLLKCDVDPNLKNASNHLAIDYLMSSKETQSRGVLMMAMRHKENISKLPSPQLTNKKFSQKVSRSKVSKSNETTFETKPKKSCDICDCLYSQGLSHFKDNKTQDGYEKMVELLKLTHKGSHHEQICKKAVTAIVKKLAETKNPEIPLCLVSIKMGTFIMIIDGLANSKKWRQLDMLVRKFRQMRGSDQLKEFASNMSVVPVVRDNSLKADEEVKLQIVINLLNSGASLGMDNGETAVKSAISEKHFKVLTELVKRGADTTKLSMYDGDTPIHAAMVIVLENEKSLVLLEFLLNQFEIYPEACPYLHPEKLDKNGDCLFHLIARAKFSTNVLKLTEMLCRKELSASYYNKEGKLPIDYITKTNDKRLQYLRSAMSVAPSREQLYGPKVPRKEDSTALLDEDLHQMQQPAESESNHQVVIELAKAVSVRDTRKRHIEDLIRLIPDSKHYIFQVDQSPSSNIVIETDEKYKRSRVDNMDDDSQRTETGIDAKNFDIGSSDLFYLDSPIRQKDTQISNTSVQESKKVEEMTFEFAHMKNVSKKDKSEINESIEEYADAFSELNSSVNTTDYFDEHSRHEESNDSNNQRDIEHHGLGEPIHYDELIDKTKKIEESKEEDTEQIKTEIRVDNDAVEDALKMNKESVDNDDVLLNRKVHEEEYIVESAEEDDEEEEKEDDYDIDTQVFDNLEWEVECTAGVWKTLRDKHVIPELKRRIVKKIQLLASGDWQPSLCKTMKNLPPSLNLFQAKLSKGRRIIWELAVAFSPRCSETAERRLQATSGEITQPVRGGRIYSEIIRVWEIILDYDKIHRCVQRIKKSHQRGETCIIQKKLRGMKDNPQVPLGTCKRYPMLYAEEDIPDSELEQHHQEMQRFYPPASSNDTEYHILKFYSFSSTLVSYVLQSIDTKVDFPFRVTDLEHAIINIKSKAPILLLGRSGTGKTTCCLYRLWSQFHAYWLKAKEADAPLLPRCAEFIHQEIEDIVSDDEHDESEETHGENDDNDEGDVESTSDNVESMSDSATACCGTEEMAMAAGRGDMYDHLHQLFITKNAVLASEVQKNFRELSHAHIMREHVQHEEEILPSRLHDVRDYQYPLFLTSRQLLLMLDASLGPPYFFERKEDGSLKVDIAGWTDLDGPLRFLPILDDDSDAEDNIEQCVEDDEEDEMDGQGQTTARKKLKVDPRREITYGVFVEEIWPRVKKKMDGYHPSLIWMEIMSFIKGSFEALSKLAGHLNKEEYFKLGRKRAPNFSGERDTIYQFFLRYEHFKKQNSLFDETDLVHHAFLRLRNIESRTWVIHQIFVDETQDFTQAELCLLIRLCQNPNDMFLTGDTAQGIMRGISFRFSDLRSLFYHAKQSMHAMGKTSSVEVPKQVYQLTHNYRSHAGILSLANSVLELLVEFFPESFDRLQPDQGLFLGPQPVLLESCSFSDLAVLLRGNKRKTSHIEFGAHQAILVMNDAARDFIPEELRYGLVLTIYEAKGLEFDDVLLYNFFKDSQASKEWRVVTEYLERLAAQQIDGSQNGENLVEIEFAVLAAEERPRPLNFDANQHKVLNSELKHLYTALTRARVNVWVFDEDVDKRAPMFEYFKARKLVKCMHLEEINETNLSEAVFAEKSSSADWLCRGEEFMKHSLYGAAAKCFGIGGVQERAKIALAHNHALKASRLKDDPRLMREEFIKAAELFLVCNRPAKAALCLQNAKERELAARIFEKLGQYERAAEIYRLLKQPMASSRCYEQLGNFDKAIEVLCDYEHFDFAIDTLRRYHILINELKQKGSPIPQQLLANEPRISYTEENLSHSAADVFHKLKNVDRMLEAVDRFEKTDDKVGFLKKYKYIGHAARILEQDGQLEKAAHLLLMYGRFDEAINMARKSRKEEVIARCLLVSCRAMMADDNREHYKKLLEERLKETFGMLKSCNDHDQTGQVLLLRAELSGNLDNIELAWKAFLSSKPFPNEAGLIECCEWLIQNTKLKENETILQKTVRGVEHLFEVCHALLEPNTQSNMGRVLKYYQLYGLAPYSQDKVEVCPKEHPLCIKMIQGLSKNKSETLYVEKSKAHESIVVFLLKRCQPWLKIIGDALKSKRNSVRVCDVFQAGFDCPNVANLDTPCSMRHEVQTKNDFKQLIKTDLMMIEFESNVLDGASSLKYKSNKKVREILNTFLLNESKEPICKYQSCVNLWDDLMPLAGHAVFINEDSRQIVELLRSKDKVLLHFKKYLQRKWYQFTAGYEKLRCSAVHETEYYLLMEFAYNLFGFFSGKRKFEKSPTEQMLNLEKQLDYEVMAKGAAINEQYYTLMNTYIRGKISVTCVAHKFLDAYSFMSGDFPDPFEAIMQFSEFQIQLSKRKSNFNFYPDLKHYLTWLEFFSCIAILLLTKLKTATSHDFVFFLPSHYMGLIRFIEATFPGQSHTVFDSVAKWEPPFTQQLKTEEIVAERLKGFALVISGHAQGVKIIDKIIDSCRDDPCNYALLERLLIMNMFLVCNIGKAVLVECEKSLMTSVCHLILPSEAPERLEHTLQEIKKCKGIEDVARTYIALLKNRNMDEKLLVCMWRNDKRNVNAKPIQLKEESPSPFSSSFLNETTLQAMTTSVVEQHEEDDVTPEEIEKGIRDKQLQMKADNESKAAKTIQKWFRQRQRCRKKLDEGANGQQRTGIDEMLDAIKIDEKMCGICGINFENKLEDVLEYQHNTLIGEKSVLNLQDTSGKWGYTSFERQGSSDATQSAWESTPENQLDSTDRCTFLLRDIKTKHELHYSHIQQSKEFERFKNQYKDVIRPKLYEINNFINQSGLSDEKFIKENYKLEEMAILRLVSECSSLEKNLYMLIGNRQWSTECRKIFQQWKEIETDYKAARPCVEQVQILLKEAAESAVKQVPASSSTLAMQGETSDDELDHFEQVVEMPSTVKTVEFYKTRSKKRGTRHRKN